MTTGKQAMEALQQARPPRLDEGEPAVDWEQIVSQPRADRSGNRRFLGWAVGLAVPVAAAAVAFALIGPQTITPPPAPPLSEAVTARQALIAAANGMLESKSSGRYFVTRTESGYVFGANGYEVLGRRYEEDWTPLSTADRSSHVGQHLGAAPFGPGSEAAWRADGSPTTWTIPGNDKDPDPSTVTAAAGQRSIRPNTTSWVRVFVLGGQIVPFETMAGLPTDAAGLRAWLEEQYRGQESEYSVEERLIQDALEIMLQMPVSNQVRAAAYHMLAELGTVQLVGPASDQRGRAGVAVEFPVDYEDGVVKLRLIFRQDTGEILANEQLDAAGRLRGYTLMVSYGWTDETPAA